MKRRLYTIAMATLMAAVSPLPLLAQAGGGAGPATNAADLTPGPLMIKVTGAMGGAQYRLAGTTKWLPVKAGDELAEGAELRTGPKGAIQFTIGTDQIYRVDRLTVVKLLRAALVPDGTIHTDVGMQYGRVSKDVDSPVRPHEDTIVTPSSTLAVRGTHVSLFDQPPFEPEAVSLTGAAVFSSLGKQLSAFGAHGEGTASVSTSHPDPSEKQISSSATTPMPANTLTAAETLQQQVLSPSGKVSQVQNNIAMLPEEALPPPTDAELATVVSGKLVFIIRWNTDTHVEMELSAPTKTSPGEFILPVLGLDHSPGGGQILFDNPGTATGGYEVITYPASYPISTYTIAAVNLGTLPTTVTFNGFVVPPGGVSRPLGFEEPNNPDPFLTMAQPQAVLQPVVNNDEAEVSQSFRADVPGFPVGSGFPTFAAAAPAAVAPKAPNPAAAAPAAKASSAKAPSAPAPAVARAAAMSPTRSSGAVIPTIRRSM
jgi:hypothetical protein